MSYKLIALDIDDTLLTPEKSISDRVKKAIREASRAGVRVVLSTGRAYMGVLPILQELELQTVAIVTGGAGVVGADGRVFHECVLDAKRIQRVLNFAHENNVHVQVYFENKFGYEKACVYADEYAEYYGMQGVLLPGLRENPIASPKALIISEPERIRELRIDAQGKFEDIKLTHSRSIFLEFLNKKTDKGVALKWVAEYYNIPIEKTIAVGDSEIDLNMIKCAGLGVAMQNSIPEVLQAADYITKSNEQDGVAHVIEKFILEK